MRHNQASGPVNEGGDCILGEVVVPATSMQALRCIEMVTVAPRCEESWSAGASAGSDALPLIVFRGQLPLAVQPP